MTKILIIGAGGVATVTAQKLITMPHQFEEITIASRTIEKCNAIADKIKSTKTQTAQLNAHDITATAELIEKTGAELVINLALPYQDLDIMEACLKANANYIDTANYEPPDNPRFEYRYQWDYHDRFAKAKLMALLGAGFDPGVTNIFTAYARKHHIASIDTLDIIDCNGGSNGHPFATNFNPEINIREVTAPARHWQNGEWIESPALTESRAFNVPEIGTRNIYLMYHEELESLTKHFPEIRRARFWMHFSDAYLTHINVLQNIGMTSIKPIHYQGREIIPLQFLKAVLPDPATLGAQSIGKSCIGTLISGDGKTIYIYNVSDHAKCYAETGGQAVSYTTGVPVAIAASLICDKKWWRAGVVNVEEMNPDPFMDMLNQHGLPWHCVALDAPISL